MHFEAKFQDFWEMLGKVRHSINLKRKMDAFLGHLCARCWTAAPGGG